MNQFPNSMNSLDNDGVKKVAMIGYALYALTLLVGISALAAIVLSYIKRDDARGTWLESHFAWQIKTFWWTLALGVLGFVTIPLLGIGFIVMFAAVVWYVYRIVKGWLALIENKTIA